MSTRKRVEFFVCLFVWLCVGIVYLWMKRIRYVSTRLLRKHCFVVYTFTTFSRQWSNFGSVTCYQKYCLRDMNGKRFCFSNRAFPRARVEVYIYVNLVKVKSEKICLFHEKFGNEFQCKSDGVNAKSFCPVSCC